MKNTPSILENLSAPGEYEKIQKRVQKILLSGETLTTFTGNKLAHTVDFRKAVSVLRSKGIPIQDQWVKSGRKRFKEYWINPEYIKTLAK
jgi:hypothetical protein